MSHSNIKYLLVGFDGLRPDMITHELMPELFKHSQAGVNFRNHRCSFPSETYVNLPSLVTGTTPSHHGMIANQYLDPKVDLYETFQGFSVPRIEKAQHAYKGKLYDALSLGEILQTAQRRMAVISTNSAGSVRLKHHQLEGNDHLLMACHFADDSHPPDEVKRIVKRLGQPSERISPDIEGLTYATDVFLEHVCEGDLPDLTILWYGEPDESCHYYGIGSPENRHALQHADTEFGRILDWWAASDERESLQIIVTSDHGHITQKTKISMQDLLQDAGFKVGKHLQNGADLALVAAHAGCIWVRDQQPALIRKIGQAMMEMTECGMVFSAPRTEIEGLVPGSFSRQLVMADHARSPDIYYILETDNEPNEYGYEGCCYSESGLPVGGSIHGGLHPKELNAVCLAVGSLFSTSRQVDKHSGIFDIAPTILHGLGIAAPSSMSGRVLSEAFADHSGNGEVKSVPEHYEMRSGPYQQVLSRTRIGGNCYLDGGWREN